MTNFAYLSLVLITTVGILAMLGCAPKHDCPPPPHPKDMYKATFAGETVTLTRLYSLNIDCSFESLPVLKIIEPPQHGKAVVAQDEVLPNYSINNPRFPCNAVKVPAAVINYTSDAGFTGSDQMSFEGFAHLGYDTGETKVNITVLQ